jgi:hypothetical protein
MRGVNRATWRRLLFFFLCIAVGVAAIITLRSVIQSVRVGLSPGEGPYRVDIRVTSNATSRRRCSTSWRGAAGGACGGNPATIEIPTMVVPRIPPKPSRASSNCEPCRALFRYTARLYPRERH